MECTRKRNATVHRTFEIHVCSADADLYDRLRFALLASAWCPEPVGMLLWSVLHALLILGGAALTVTVVPICFAVVAAVDCLVLLFAIIDKFFELVIYFILALSFVVCWAIWLMLKLSLALISCEGAWMQRMRVAWRDSVEYWNSWVHINLFEWTRIVRQFSFISQHVAWLVSNPWWGLLWRWCEEVVHLHTTIALVAVPDTPLNVEAPVLCST